MTASSDPALRSSGPPDARDLVDRVVGTLGYLRVSVGGSRDGWVSCARIIGAESTLRECARALGPGFGTTRDDVAVSLFVQGYAFQIASIAVGGWVLGDEIVHVAPSDTAVAFGPQGPNAIRLDEPRLVRRGDRLAGLSQHLVDGHLAPLVERAHESCRIGRALLWGNVASACAFVFRALSTGLGRSGPDLHARALAFQRAVRPELRAAGRFRVVRGNLVWERKSCCLAYLGAGGSRCDDCSLWSDDEREARYGALFERLT